MSGFFQMGGGLVGGAGRAHWIGEPVRDGDRHPGHGPDRDLAWLYWRRLPGPTIPLR